MQQWRDWWPHLRSIDIQRTPELVGSYAACAWSSPVGYGLTFRVHLTDVLPERRVSLEVEGDLTGKGSVVFVPVAAGSLLRICWQVQTTRRWMNVAGGLFRPVFRFGHDAVMRGGERGLNKALRRSHVEQTADEQAAGEQVAGEGAVR
jgi:hypothetical protein